MASHLGDTTSDNKQTKKILSEGALQQIISQGALQQIVPHRALYSRSFLIGRSTADRSSLGRPTAGVRDTSDNKKDLVCQGHTE